MRRITQLVALMVALLFAGQSALAEAPCSQWFHSGDGPIPACCAAAGDTAAPHLSTDCHGSMRFESMTSECNQSGCQMATLRVGAQAITTAKSRAGKATALVAIAQLPSTSASVLTPRFIEGASAPGPAKYLLFQVFRI